jgi:FKBP-type peptidyl-prolyl cis-trans isomerase FklB
MLGALLALGATACSSTSSSEEDTWKEYTAWRDLNKAWFSLQGDKVDENGDAYYESITTDYYPNNNILVHWFNDRSETANNLVPLVTSTVSTCYYGRLYDDTPVDSSYTQTDAIYTSEITNFIKGWQIVLQNMHVGDSVEVVIPYQLGYGTTITGSIPPYSMLKFNMRLVDIPYYQARP